MRKYTKVTKPLATLLLAFTLFSAQSSYCMAMDIDEGPQFTGEVITPEDTQTTFVTPAPQKQQSSSSAFKPYLPAVSKEDKEYLNTIINDPDAETPLAALVAREALRLGKRGFSLGELFDMGIRPGVFINTFEALSHGCSEQETVAGNILIYFDGMPVISANGTEKWLEYFEELNIKRYDKKSMIKPDDVKKKLRANVDINKKHKKADTKSSSIVLSIEDTDLAKALSQRLGKKITEIEFTLEDPRSPIYQ